KRNQLTRIKKFYTTNIEHFIIIFLELSRVSNHLLSISTNIMDLGGVTPYLWVFDIREQIMEVIEFSTGSRLHSQLLTKKQLNNTKINTSSTLKKIKLIVSSITSKISELYELIYSSKVLVDRLYSLGIASINSLRSYLITGPILRSGGVVFDVRFKYPYSNYNYLQLKAITCDESSALDRLIIRLEEINSSISIICLATSFLLEYDNKLTRHSSVKIILCDDMEKVIHKFVQTSKIPVTPQSTQKNSKNAACICFSESPKGVLTNLNLVSRESIPFRSRIKNSGILNLYGTQKYSKNIILTDLIANIASVDIIMGEVDK
ncbi:MAG: hypothetical protein GY679_00050, partial [Mycoplasma sp.]|nr:hypothetical protein [Mycoplasma sp.]